MSENDLELAAWEEWKILCQIPKCSEEHRGALRKRLFKVCKAKLDGFFGDRRDWRTEELNDDVWKDIFAEMFDNGIAEKAEEKQTGQKLYKSEVWAKVASSGDPPLRIIRGTLAADHTILTVFLERLIEKRGWGTVLAGKGRTINRIHIRQNGRVTTRIDDAISDEGKGKGHYVNVPGSIDKPIQGKDGSEMSLADLIPEELRPQYLKRDDVMLYARRFGEMFDFNDSVLLLAYFSRISLDDPIIKETCGIGRTRAGELLKGTYDKKTKETVAEGALSKMACLQDDFNALAHDVGPLAVSEMVMSLLKNQIRPEKRAAGFLSVLQRVQGR